MLTEEQKTLIVNSSWVVNTILEKVKAQGNEDLRQTLFLYLCKCAERFNKDLGVKWTTFAYKNLYFYAIRELKREQKKQRATVPIEKIIQVSDDYTGENQMIETACLSLLMQPLDEMESKVAYLCAMGYTNKSISTQISISIRKVQLIKGQIKQKYIALGKNTPPLF